MIRRVTKNKKKVTFTVTQKLKYCKNIFANISKLPQKVWYKKIHKNNRKILEGLIDVKIRQLILRKTH